MVLAEMACVDGWMDGWMNTRTAKGQQARNGKWDVRGCVLLKRCLLRPVHDAQSVCFVQLVVGLLGAWCAVSAVTVETMKVKDRNRKTNLTPLLVFPCSLSSGVDSCLNRKMPTLQQQQ